MKIEILETFLDGRDRYEKGDIRSVSNENGTYFCGNGWAKDVSGNVPTGERQTTKRVLDVRNASHAQHANEV